MDILGENTHAVCVAIYVFHETAGNRPTLATPVKKPYKRPCFPLRLVARFLLEAVL